MYAVLVALHILLTVTWLGVDAGVFIGSHMIRNRSYSAEARFLVSRLMGYLDLGPRLSVPLIFAVGLALAYLGGWAQVHVALGLGQLAGGAALVPGDRVRVCAAAPRRSGPSSITTRTEMAADVSAR